MNDLFNILPPTQKRIITASVGLITQQNNPNLYSITKNKRGWDIPGGHVEKGETPLQAFRRELYEETSCKLLPGATLIAILENKIEPATGIAVFKGTCELAFRASHPEIVNSKFVSKAELLRDYFGDKKLLLALLNLQQGGL